MSVAGAGRIQSAVASTVSTGGVIALLVMASLWVSACGSGTSSSSSVSPSPTPTAKVTLISKVAACTLVTAADASTAAGTTVSSASGTSGAQIPGACFYISSDGAASVLVFAQVYADSGSAAAVSPEQMAAALNGSYGIANAKVVTGIGDKAVEYSFTTPGASGTLIFVFKSNVVMMIAVSPATNTNAVEQLARTAVGRL